MKWFVPALCLVCGCGVSLTTSEFNLGIIDGQAIVDDNGNRVVHEHILGLHVQWLPYFSFGDVRRLFSSKKE